jgi:hypothetical protein
MKKLLLLLSLFLFFSLSIFSATCTSGNGTYPNWASAGWTCSAPPFGGPPGCNDQIIINGTIQMSTDVDYSACPSPMTITINGTLNFTTNGIRFRLPANSTVILNTGAQIIKTFPGGGSSTLISVGGSNVWTAGDGNISGPLVLGAPLPIELVGFDAMLCDKKEVCLSWRTATETNNDYFSVERSDDGVTFESIAELDGAGNSTVLLSYSYTDINPLEGTSYYRIRQTDFNGKYSYTSISAVSMESVEENLSFNVYPNPNNGQDISIELKAKKGEEILVVVTDVTGKESYSKVIILENNSNNVIAIDPSNKLQSGIYFITATSQQSIYNKKMVVN